jgi:hypothetical protein
MNPDRSRLELYRIPDDPLEMNNLAARIGRRRALEPLPHSVYRRPRPGLDRRLVGQRLREIAHTEGSHRVTDARRPAA